LTAFWLCDVAQNLIHQTALKLPSDWKPDLESHLLLTKNEMLRGQIKDLEQLGKTIDDILDLYRLKSGALYSFSASAPAVALGLSNFVVELSDFGLDLGTAYQIADDIYDCIGTEANLGKDIGKDEHKLTIPRMLGVEEAYRLRNQYKAMAIGKLTRLSGFSSELEALVDQICG
jgi:geranylgeranyl pyrophosphate synthase